MSGDPHARLRHGLIYLLAWLVALAFTLAELIYGEGRPSGLLQRDPLDRTVLLCSAALSVLLLALGMYNIALYLRSGRAPRERR